MPAIGARCAKRSRLRSRRGTKACPATVMRSVATLSVSRNAATMPRRSGSGRRAVALCPDDIWAAHAVAHVCEMQDRIEDGFAGSMQRERRLEGREQFRLSCRLASLPLFARAGRYDETLALYDREVRAELTDEHLDITNAVSLLWRLEQFGIDVGGRWRRARGALALEYRRPHAGLRRCSLCDGAGRSRGSEDFGRWRQFAAPLCRAIARDAGPRHGARSASPWAMPRRRIAAATSLARSSCFCPCARPLAHRRQPRSARSVRELLIDSAVKAGRADVHASCWASGGGAPVNRWARMVANRVP